MRAKGEEKEEEEEERIRSVDTVGSEISSHIGRCVNVVDGGRIKVDGMETLVRAVQHLQAGILLHGQIHN